MLNNLMKAHREHREEGVAMIMAILIMFILLSLVASMTAFAMMGLDKGKDVQFLTGSQNAADSAISHAMTLANSTAGQVNGKGIDQHVGVSRAAYGKVSANEINPDTGDGTYNWRWYAEKVVGAKDKMAYDIYATGYSDTPTDDTARTYKIRIEAMVVESAAYGPSGVPFYDTTRVGMFQWGALSIEKLTIGQRTAVQMYDSSKNIGYPTTPVMGGRVASNNLMELGTNTTIAEYVFLQASESIDQTRCILNCSGVPLTRESYGISINTGTQAVASKCPLAASSYSDWVASQNGGVLSYSAGSLCFRNIIFDVDTTLAANYTSAKPAEMLAKGNVTVHPGVEVNRQTKTYQGPLSLRVYSQSGSKISLENGNSSNPTKFTGLLAGETANCLIGENVAATSGDGRGTALYGAVSCRNVTTGANSSIWWDNQIEQVTDIGSPTSKKIWSIVSYQEM